MINTKAIEISRKLPAFKLRGWLLEQLFYWSHPIYGALFKRKKQPWSWTVQQLRQFPSDSFGKSIFEFINENKFEMLAKFESHDALHVLLGYGTHIIDEVRMQFCLLGNGKRSLYLFGVIIIGWMAFPECWHLFIHAFKRGKTFAPVHRWKFEHLLFEPMELLSAKLKGDHLEDVPLFI